MEKSPESEARDRFDEIDARLNAIERRLGMVRSRIVSESAPTAPLPSGTVRSRPGSDEARVEIRDPTGGNFLGAVGVLFFILAAGFFIRLTVDSGWLTPIRQLGGATLFGVMLIALGYNLRGKDAAYSGLLPGAGVVVLFLAAYGGHLYYGLYDSLRAAGIVAFVSVGALLLFKTFRHDFFLVSSIIGTYLVPILLVPRGGNLIGGNLYFIFWSVLYCACAILLGRRLLIGATAYLTLAVFSMYANGPRVYAISPEIQFWFQALQFLILCASVAIFSVVRRVSLTSTEAWAFFPVLLLFYAIEYSLLDTLTPGSAPWYALIFMCVLVVLYNGVRRALARESLDSAPMVAAFSTFVMLHAVYIELLPRSYGTWFALGLFILVTALRSSALVYARFWPVHLMVWSITGLEFFEALFNFNQSEISHVMVKNLVFSILLGCSYFGLSDRKGYAWIMGLANIQALFGLNRLASLVVQGDAAQYLTSGLWALLALSVLVAGNHLRDAGLARSSLAVFGLVAAKVLFHDIDQSSSGIRVFALMLIGAFMYAGGLFLRRVNQWSRE